MAGPPTGIDPALYQALVAGRGRRSYRTAPVAGSTGRSWPRSQKQNRTSPPTAAPPSPPTGQVAPPILGIRLDGTTPGTATIADSDRGALDGDPLFDRAVGPFQFIPTSWALYGRDANRDGRADPHNVFDAAAAAAEHLCRAGWEFADPDQAAAAVYGYNPSWSYVTHNPRNTPTPRTPRSHRPRPTRPAPFPRPPAGRPTTAGP